MGFSGATKLWLIGGNYFVTEGSSENKEFNDVWVSDDGISWKKAVENAPFEARTYHKAVVYQDRLFILGGRNSESSKYFNDVWYTSDGINWEKGETETAFSPRAYFATLVADDNLIVIGGEEIVKSIDYPDYFDKNYLTDLWYTSAVE